MGRTTVSLMANSTRSIIVVNLAFVRWCMNEFSRKPVITRYKQLLSFLAHGPKRACGDVYSLLCALHAVCTELFPPCRRTGPT